MSMTFQPRPVPAKIKAFNIDFNWGFDPAGNYGPAMPGEYAHADPAAHVDWYVDMGVNVIQNFCVSYNGHAWYRQSQVAPVTPGMKHDFLPEMTALAHDRGLLVMGYFCCGANRVWETAHPDQVRQKAPMWKLPFTLDYLNYFCHSVKDALRKTEVDGFMVDWFISPDRSKDGWLDCERTMWRELMDEPFPASGEPDAAAKLEFERREVLRAWDHLTAAVRDVRPALIWVNSPWEISRNLWENHRALKEMDWVLNECHKIEQLEWIQQHAGTKTKIIQNMAGGGRPTEQQWAAFDFNKFGLYGFSQADPKTTYVVDTENNKANIARIREMFQSHQQETIAAR
ncbi:MAG: hypothetical protein IT440_14560 [Phycisphaeraceae bacterium]|nr:hypothetical protein [Phycisphaeraceae bacterium]